MTYSPTVRFQPRSQLTSIDNTIPAPNLKKCMVDSCTKVKPTIRPCSRIVITLSPGKSVNTLYPFALHESLGDLWDYSVTAGKFVLRSRGCDPYLYNMQMHSWHRCPGTGKLQKYRMYCKECWIHHIMAVTFKLNRLAHIIKLRKQNCMQVTKPSCTLVGAKSLGLLLEREYQWRRQNCWTQHNGQREGSIVVSAMDKGRRNLWVN